MANSIEISACGWYVASPAVPFAPSILRALILVSGLLLQASPAYPPRRSLIETPGAAPLHHTVEHVRSDGEVVAFQDVVLTDNELRFTLTSSSALPISAECTPDVQYVELRCGEASSLLYMHLGLHTHSISRKQCPLFMPAILCSGFL